jgi:hypothetical protein
MLGSLAEADDAVQNTWMHVIGRMPAKWKTLVV